ncbi:MAG TPA: o-succinylbenzoate synthase [Bryobacterales bacterium]|nr:o-succinylbenzoate synthase [Bryobacterales bacterium]
MKIDKIILHWVQIPLLEPFRISNGSVAVKDSIVVEVQAEACGGFGEASPMAGSFYSAETPESTWQALAERLAPAVMEGGFQAALVNGPPGEPFAKAGLDGALWDHACWRTATPLWQMLGSALRPIPSGVAIGIFDTIDELLDRVARYRAQGYQRVKIKIQPGWDLEPVRAVRERFGGIPLMADANAAYAAKDIPLFEELDRFGLMMYEQPLAKDALEEMAELQRRVRTPVCADESAEPENLERIITLGAARIINIKIQRVGGLGPAIAMHDKARAAGLGCWLGTMPELGIASAQGLHLATFPGFVYPTDVEASARWYCDDLVEPSIDIDERGFLHIPPGPGSGFAVSREKLERYTIKNMEFTA